MLATRSHHPRQLQDGQEHNHFRCDGKTTLREAINLANSQTGADAITFDSKVFGTRQTIVLASALPPINSDLSITGTSGGMSVILNGSGFNLLRISSGIVSLSELGFTGSSASGIDNAGDLTLSRSGFGGLGTGLSNSGTARVQGGAFTGNGMGITNTGTLSLVRVAVGGNTFGLLNTGGGRATVQESTLSGNAAAIQSSGTGTLALERSTLANNGDALRSVDGTVRVQNSTFVGNTNAVLNSNAALSVLNSTLSGNGSGISNTSGTVNVRNTINAGNGTNVSGTLSGNAFNISSGTPAQAGLETDGNGFPVLKNNGGPTQTVALVQGGQAVNAGDPNFDATAVPTDGRGAGFGRVMAGRLDIGAFELNLSNFSSSLVVTTPTDEDDGTSDPVAGSGTSLREAMLYANQKGGQNTISFDANVFGTRKSITLGGALPLITSDLSISGPAAGVTLTGTGSSVVLSTRSGTTVVLSRLDLNGAGFPGLQNNGTLTLLSSRVRGSGTGFINAAGAKASVQDTLVQDNTFGIQNSGDLTVQSSTLSGNAVGVGNSGTFSLANSTLSGNGDGVRSDGASVSVLQSTFVSNTRALVTTGGSLAVQSATITGNGAGIKIQDGGQLDVLNSLIVGNGTNGSGVLTTNAFNILSGTPAQAGLETDGNGFPVLKNNGGPTLTVALVLGGRAVNAGDAAITTGTDQRGTGFARVVGGRADIGAFELQSSSGSLQKSSVKKPSAPAS